MNDGVPTDTEGRPLFIWENLYPHQLNQRKLKKRHPSESLTETLFASLSLPISVLSNLEKQPVKVNKYLLDM